MVVIHKASGLPVLLSSLFASLESAWRRADQWKAREEPLEMVGIVLDSGRHTPPIEGQMCR